MKNGSMATLSSQPPCVGAVAGGVSAVGAAGGVPDGVSDFDTAEGAAAGAGVESDTGPGDRVAPGGSGPIKSAGYTSVGPAGLLGSSGPPGVGVVEGDGGAPPGGRVPPYSSL